MQGFEKVTVYGVSFDAASKQPIVLLKAEGRTSSCPSGSAIRRRPPSS